MKWHEHLALSLMIFAGILGFGIFILVMALAWRGHP